MSRRVQVWILLFLVLALPAAGGEPDWDGIEKQILQPKKCPPGMRLVQTDHPDQGYTQACLDERARQHGWALIFYENGQAKIYREAQDGRLHGKSMGWYESGKRQYFCEYQQGDKHGPEVRWFENGQKASEGRYRKGYEEGFWQYWFANGRLRKRGHYRQGMTRGKWEYWKEDGSASEFEVSLPPPKLPATAQVKTEQVGETAAKPLPAGVLLGGALVAKKLLLQEDRLGQLKQIVVRGMREMWLLGENGALLVDGGYAVQKWIEFPERAEAASLLDLEGDGREEFLVRSRVPAHHGFVELNYIIGSADAEPRQLRSLARSRSVVAGDLDGDGKLELAVLDGWSDAAGGGIEWGIEILDAAGKVVRRIPVADVQQLLLADRDRDGRAEMFSLNRRGRIEVHASEGAAPLPLELEHRVWSAALCPWPDQRGRPHLLYWHETSIWLVDTLSGSGSRFDAPGAASGAVAGASGVPVRLRRERPAYLAAAVRLKQSGALLYLLSPKGRVEYLDVFDEPIEALAVSELGEGVQELLVGSRGKLWSYRFLEQSWENLAEAVYRVLAFGTKDIRLVDVEAKNDARQLREGWFEWTVYLQGTKEELEQIACVQYSLPPSFPDANQLVCERGAGPRPFALTREGWGMFTLPVRLYLKSGPVQELYHRIRF